MSTGDASSIKSLSLTSLLAKESRLLREAAQAIPHSFSTCTYDLGYIRQAVYLCRTCTELDGGKPKGVCGACSVACHANHEQLELFPKRHFRCDCPTSCSPVNCTLHKGLAGTKEPANNENVYGQNFYCKFCRCGRDYDPLTEMETMVQCVACEDWWHESCLHLRARPSQAAQAATASHIPSSPSHPPSEYEDDDDDDEEEDPSSLLQASSYDSLICGGCVATIEPLQRWGGTPGVKMIVKRKGPHQASSTQAGEPLSSPTKAFLASWEVIGDDVSEGSPSSGEPKAIRKRSASPSDAGDTGVEPPVKKTKLEAGVVATEVRPTRCIAPLPNPIAQDVFARLRARTGGATDARTPSGVDGEGDIFLSHGWRERWCRCEDCLPAFRKYPFLLEEESTYAPPDDPDSAVSFEELGLRALQTLPRDKALDSIRAFNDMRDDLMAYLRPFAENGEVVSESHIKEFFDTRMSNSRLPKSHSA